MISAESRIPPSTFFAPIQRISIITVFTATYVKGFMSAATLPTFICAFAREEFIFVNFSFCISSLPKARMTRTPPRFSRVAPVTSSRFFCTFLYIGAVINIIPKTITNITIIATTKIKAICGFIVKAIIIAPNTINGLLKNRRRNIFAPFCT